MEQRDGAEFWKAMSIMGLFLGIVLGISAAAFMRSQAAAVEPNMDCYANPSGFLATDGWLRVYEADRQRMAVMVSDQKAVVRREPSLVCHDVEQNGTWRGVSHEWWWKSKL